MRYNVIGLMSGTSMDGLDLAYCSFLFQNNQWSFEILFAETIDYSGEWLQKLNGARFLSPSDLEVLDNVYGIYLSQQVELFMLQHSIIQVDLVASHGHTVHHRPLAGITKQIGKGEKIFENLKTPTVFDFRTQDVLMGGQGAPLVPIGDELLFSNFESCLNLGGFANISFGQKGVRKAFDICPANIVLNYLSLKLGLPYDENGNMAKSGSLNLSLLEELNRLEYYAQEIPKSLGVEWVEENIYPAIEKELKIENTLHTVVEHVAHQIAKSIDGFGIESVLVTGGGAFNAYLISRIKVLSSAEIMIPSSKIVNYKEALVFAFLGVLRLRNENNVLSSVTGAPQDHCSGNLLL